jgi:hypothetical protein
MTRLAAGLFFLGVASSAFAQDAVRLKNGRLLAGEVALKADDPEGFTVALWETGGVVRVRWDQISAEERRRLTKTEAAPPVPLVQTTIVVTRNNEYFRGILTKEDARSLWVKERGKAAPTQIALSRIAKRETAQLPESDVYTPLEIFEMRERQADPKNAEQQRALAAYAQTWKLHEQAAACFGRAADLWAAARADDPRVAELRGAAAEMNARRLLEQIEERSEKRDFDKAIEAAKELQEKYGATPTGLANTSLESELTARREAFQKNRDREMLESIVKHWPGERDRLLRQIALETAANLDQAKARAEALDAEIAKALAKRFAVTPDEVTAWWSRRGETAPEGSKKKLRRFSASYGSGTWIARGGQDGGSDFIEFADPQNAAAGQPGAAPRTGPNANRNQNRNPNNRQPPPQNQPQADPNKELPTAAQWWSAQSASGRHSWLEAYYAEHSQMVTVEAVVNERICGTCGGDGIVTTVRVVQTARVKCPRCHQHSGTDANKQISDISIRYY